MKKLFFLLLFCLTNSYALAANENTLLFGVNEGSSGSADFLERQEKYRGLSDLIATTLKKQARLESASNLNSLTSNLQTARYDLLLVRPSHISAKAMRDHKYSLVVSAKGDAYAYFITHKDSPYKKLTDIRGKRIAMPDKLAYPTSVALAMMQELGINPEKENIQYFRTQEAVGYAVKQKLVDVGVVISYSKVATEWKKDGNTFLLESKKLPFWSIIASPNMSPENVAVIRSTLIKLNDTPEGKKIMNNIGINGFVPGNQQDYIDLLTWLKQ